MIIQCLFVFQKMKKTQPQNNQQQQSHSNSMEVSLQQVRINSKTIKDQVPQNIFIRQRIPNSMLSNLKQKGSEAKHDIYSQNQQGGNRVHKQSAVGKSIRSKFKEFKNKVNCQICEGQMIKDERLINMCECQHKFSFCQSCLHHYAIYKINNFEEVPCPHEGCKQLMSIDAHFFKQLPLDIQNKYKKIHKFHLISTSPNKKLCPIQKCQGIIEQTTQKIMICNHCHSQFCAKCLLAKHEGECDDYQVELFRSNLHYRQCQKCKFVIEKNQGCNHMTCRCGYQFCYVCGVDWEVKHYGEHDQNGELRPVNHVEMEDDGCTCTCWSCGNENICVCLLKLPVKMLLYLFFFIFLVVVLGVKNLFQLLTYLFIAVITGTTAFACEYLFQLEGKWFILAIIFYPFVMLIGIGIAFKQIYTKDIISDMCHQYRKIFNGGMETIYDF